MKKARTHCLDVEESSDNPITSYDDSAEFIGSNQDLINEILSKLEPKHRQRCAIICKFWYNVIKNRPFKYKLPPPSHLLVRWSTIQDRQRSIFPAIKYSAVPLHNHITTPKPPLDFLESNQQHVNGIKIVQSCNSLFLCCADSSIKKINKNNYVGEKNIRNGLLFPNNASNVEHYVYNPGTNKHRFLPWPPVRKRTTRHVIAMNLAFDPIKSYHYKVVCLSTVSNSCSSYNQVDIYSSEKWKWRASKAEFPPNCSADVDFTNGVFFNGGVHWASHTGTTSIYFDVKNECFKIMPMPPVQGGGSRRRSVRYFGESSGRLLLIDSPEVSPAKFVVFGMEKNYSGWKVKYCVNLSCSCLFYNQRVLNRFKILSVICCGGEKGDVSLVMYCPDRDKGLMTYNLREQKLDKMHPPVPGWDLTLMEEKGFSAVHPLMITKFEVW